MTEDQTDRVPTSTEDVRISLLREAEKRIDEAKTGIEYASGNAQYDEQEVRKAIAKAKERIAKAQELPNQVGGML